jgi:uncharacterized membrane protein YozB (DUF420 family)
MSTIPAPQRSVWRLRAKYLLFAFIGLMIVYVIQHNEAFLLNDADPVWEHYQPIKWWLLPHGIAGAIAIFLAISQFSSRIRARHITVHRTLGRIYVGLVVVAAPLGVTIQYLNERTGDPRSFTIATVVDASLWLLATGMAFWCIRGRRIEQHRQWMTRSFAMAIVFLEVRVILGVTGWETLGVAVVETVVWTCVAFAYPLADIVLLIEDRLRARTMQRQRDAGPIDRQTSLPSG